jgi:hypothetical protein
MLTEARLTMGDDALMMRIHVSNIEFQFDHLYSLPGCRRDYCDRLVRVVLIRLAQPNKACAPLMLAIEKALARHPGPQPSVPEGEARFIPVSPQPRFLEAFGAGGGFCRDATGTRFSIRSYLVQSYLAPEGRGPCRDRRRPGKH